MSLTAHYEANFDDFYAAVQKADVELKRWETSGEAVERSMNRVANSLTGSKVIQDATMMADVVGKLGGVSTLTEKELAKVSKTAAEAAAKMRAMGEDVPDKIQHLADESSTLPPIFSDIARTAAGMFTLSAIIDFTKEIVALGGEIKALATATGVTYTEMQQLMYIAAQTNTPIEALTKGIQTLQQRLGDDSSGAAASLKRLGINLDDFNRADPQKQLYMVAEALGAITDESKFAVEANALFGGSWRQMAPALKSDMDGIGASATTMSNDAIEGMEHFTTGLTSLSTTASAVAGEVAGAFGDWLFGDYLTESIDKALELEGAIKKIPPAWDLASRAGNGLKLTTDELNGILAKSNQELADLIVKNKAAAEAQAELTSAGRTWQDTVRGLSVETTAAVKGYLEAGVSQKSLATAYGLTNTEVRAITESLKAEHLAIETTNRLWTEYNTTVTAQTGTATDQAIGQIERWASNVARVMREAGADTQEFYDALAETTHAKLNDVLIDWDALGNNSQASYARNLEQIAQKSEATFQYMLGNSADFSVATIQRFGETAQAARDAADHWRESWEEAGTAASAAVETSTRAATAALAGIMGGGGAPLHTQPGKGGGTVDTSGLVIPGGMENLMKRYTAAMGGGGALGGTIVRAEDPLSWGLSHGLVQRPITPAPTFPAGGIAGGAPINQTINMNGLLGTDDPATRALIKNMVGDAMAESMRGQRLLSSA
jgi:hypothetical protein